MVKALSWSSRPYEAKLLYKQALRYPYRVFAGDPVGIMINTG